MRLVKCLLPGIFFSFSILYASDFEGNNHELNGISLFEKAVSRYWSGSGSTIGNIGLLDRAAIEFDYISDPAMRNFYIANTELYKGYVTNETRTTSEGRNYYKEAMRFATLSLKHSSRSDTYRLLAEAGYALMMSRKIRIKPKLKANVSEWIQIALYMNPDNIPAELLKIKLDIRQAGRNKKKLNVLRSRLETLEKQPDIHNTLIFRIRILLSEVCRKLRDKKFQEFWYEQAANVFPENTMFK